MATRTFIVPRVVECGEKTCASEPGKFCPFIMSDMGQRSFCSLFKDEAGKETRLWEDQPGGWVMRCQACLDAEPAEGDDN